jgi:antitoxin (DNA-binding transcriptional repressor) of toxin-antitoxin stability system
MSDGVQHVVLPVSALKANATTVFDTLAAGRTVYVSKRGEVVAAFQPFEAVPEGIAAAYASPLPAIELTARQLGREVPSAEITEAAEGLPSLVTKNGRIYVVLTPAVAPRPVTVPDRDVAGARAEAVRGFQEEHPNASLDDVVEFTTNWRAQLGVGAPLWAETPRTAPDLALVHSDRDVSKELDSWRKRGSPVEGLVEALLNRVAALLQPGPDRLVAATAVVAPAVFNLLYSATRGNPTAMVRRGERSETTGDIVEARTNYVAAVFAPESPSVGAMWRLGDLARRQGNPAEAFAWYRLAFGWDDIEARGSKEKLEIMPAVKIAER